MKLGYDLSIMTYSPDGRLFQQEYCHNMIRNSPPIYGVLCKDGAIFGISESFQNEGHGYTTLSSKKYSMGNSLLICSNGIIGDCDYVIERLRKENYLRRETYSELIDLKFAFDTISSCLHLHASYWHLRPLACSFLIGSNNKNGPEIMVASSLSSHSGCHGVIIGKYADEFSKEFREINRKKKKIRRTLRLLKNLRKKSLYDPERQNSLLFSASRENIRFENLSINFERILCLLTHKTKEERRSPKIVDSEIIFSLQNEKESEKKETIKTQGKNRLVKLCINLYQIKWKKKRIIGFRRKINLIKCLDNRFNKEENLKFNTVPFENLSNY